MVYEDMFQRPIQLVHNRIHRGYPGGREIERLRGNDALGDDLSPEAWVGSTTLARDHDSVPDGKLGYAQAYLADGGRVYLKDMIDTNPIAFLGEKHVVKFGSNTSILVKLLDAEKKLSLQCHPDGSFARKCFNSNYGKVESWYVIGLREDQPEPPYLLLGFKKGITREKFQKLFIEGDIKLMENWCHKITPRVGEMYYVPAGTPHLLGPGCFVVETQEPSDITVKAFMQKFDNEQETGMFIERSMGSFNYIGRGKEDTLNLLRIKPKSLLSAAGGTENLLLGGNQNPYFSVTELTVTNEMGKYETGVFLISIVLDGTGWICYDGGCMNVKKGDELFFSADTKNVVWKTDNRLHVINCHPPDAL
jgi:mannose-6-phosphate isomerase